MALEAPHIQFPFGRGANGKLACVEQDTPEHAMSCNTVVVHCPIGFRDDRPEFGWAWPDMRTAPLNLASLKQALEQFGKGDSFDLTQMADLARAVVNVSVDVGVRSDTAEE